MSVPSCLGPPVVRLCAPEEVVAAVPVLLGFHPSASLVALLLDENRLVCTMRMDLGPDLLERISTVAQRAGAGSCLLLSYGPDPVDVDLAREVLGDVALLEVLHVHDGHFESSQVSGTKGQIDPTVATPLNAWRVFRGHPVPCASREEAEGHYLPTPSHQDGYERVELDPDLRARAQGTVQDLLDLRVEWDQDAAARVVLALRDVLVRDYLLAVLIRDDHLDTVSDALVRLALTSPKDLRAPVAVTAAAVLVARGTDPVGTWALLDLAEGESLAELLTQAIAVGLPPDEWRRVLLATLPEIEDRLGGAL